MEKKFTLMKTLTAFLELLFNRSSQKNSLEVQNDQAPATVGVTMAHDHSLYRNDAKHADASFLFFEETAIADQPSSIDSPATISDEQKLQNTEELHKVNDELALRSAPQHNNWKQQANDDLAACSPIVNRNSVIEARESVTVINDLKNIFPTTTENEKTRTNKNGAWLPFASFCFFIRRLVHRLVRRNLSVGENFNEGESFSEGGLSTNSFAEILKAGLRQSIRRLFYNAELSKNRKPVLLIIPIRSRLTGKRNYTDGIKL